MYKYKKTTWNKKRMYSHKKVWMMAHGPVPRGCVLHHINGNSKDNRLVNLTVMEKEAHHLLHQKDRIGKPEVLAKYYKTHDVWNKGLSKRDRKLKDWHARTIKTRRKNYFEFCKQFYERYKKWTGPQHEFCRQEGINRNTLYWRLKKTRD